MTEQPASSSEPVPGGHPPTPQPRLPRPLVIAGGVLGGLVLLIVGFFVVRSLVAPSEGPGPEETPLGTPIVSPLPTVMVSPLVVEVGESQVPLAVPTLLEVGGGSFSVQPSVPQADDPWAIGVDRPDTAVWLYGTVVNYVLGLQPTDENREMMEGIQKGDRITLRLSGGTTLTFLALLPREVPAGSEDLFDQTQPRLTLILLDPTTWTVVRADFEAAVEPTPAAGEAAVGVGQPVQVGDVRVVVLEGHAERGGAGLAPGTMLYFVEISVRNTGSVSLLPDAFLMMLEDGVGNRYGPSPDAASAGDYGPLPDAIGPGQEAKGSVAYIVPESLAGPTLTWIFSPAPTSELRARFSIPYTPPTSPAPLPEVEVLDAFLGEGGSTLHVVAEIYNPGADLLTVTADDVSLSSSAGPGELEMAAPPFPWTIPGGESREVELQFARPGASTAIVTILGYTFEISGMP